MKQQQQEWQQPTTLLPTTQQQQSGSWRANQLTSLANGSQQQQGLSASCYQQQREATASSL